MLMGGTAGNDADESPPPSHSYNPAATKAGADSAAERPACRTAIGRRKGRNGPGRLADHRNLPSALSTHIMKFTLDCDALTELLSLSQDGELPLTTRSRMRLHLVTCQACRNFDDQLRFLRSVLKELNAQARSDRRPDNERLH
jgi:hypothetical protein